MEGVGLVTLVHKVYQTCYDGKERRALVAEIVKEEALKGVFLKPPGFGARNKVSTATCMVCLIDPKLHDTVSFNLILNLQFVLQFCFQVEGLNANPVMFERTKHLFCSVMHLPVR